MEEQQARDLVELLDEIIWRFGSQGPEGYCCGDISYTEYRALRVLAKGQNSMQRLGQQLGLTKSGATRVVDRIEHKGYARRERDTDDHRVCCVTLTDAGRALVDQSFTEFAGKARESLTRMDMELRHILVAALRSFVRTFENK